MLARGGAHEMDHRQGEFSFPNVDAKSFSDGALVADDVENVILNLERCAECLAIEAHALDDRFIRPGEFRAEQAAGGAQNGGFVRDDLRVSLLVEVQIISVVNLEKLAFTHLISGVANHARGEL